MITSTLADEALSSWDVLAWHYWLTAIGTIIEEMTQVATTLPVKFRSAVKSLKKGHPEQRIPLG